MTCMAQRSRGDPDLYQDGEPGIHFDNSGTNDLLVPGFGLPVPIELLPEERFAHGFNDWGQNRLTAREIAMLQLMNTISDQARWYVDINDPLVVEAWAEEAQRMALISPAAWDWCLKELCDKADYHKKTGVTHVLDAASRICKSDELLSTALLEKLSGEVETLAAGGDGALLLPDMFPLAYGRSRVLSGNGSVGVLNAVEFAGQGVESREQIWKCPKDARIRCDGTPRRGGFGRGRGRGGGGRGGAHAPCNRCGQTRRDPERSWERRGDRFSADFQWLPAEVRFKRTIISSSESKVEIRSYINNLHPRRHASLYDSVQKCIEASIQPWNEILVYRDRGRTPQRIRTYGVEWTPSPPSPTDLARLGDILNQGDGEPYDETKRWLRQFFEQPDNPRAPGASLRYPMVGSDWEEKFTASEAVTAKYHRVKEWLHPEPGVSFNYNEWKRGENNRPVFPGREHSRGGSSVVLPVKENHQFYSIALEETFAQRGLQVIVEIGGVELTPDHQSQPGSDWQLSGLPNDHIVATTMIYFATENITFGSGSLTFRVEAHLDPYKFWYGTGTNSNPYHPLEALANIFGCSSHLELGGDDDENAPGGPALQELGTVVALDGRLIAWPNVLQHRIEPFSLVDPSRPGRRRWLKLHLVDPHYRICSTMNVPPQQFEWWYEAGLGKIDWAAREMPKELVQEVEALVGQFPITEREAQELSERSREERKRKYRKVNDNVPLYCFGDWAAVGSAHKLRG